MSADPMDRLQTPVAREIARRLMAVPEGWASSMQLSWDVAGRDDDGRRRVRGVVSDLARHGVLERLFVRDRNEPQLIVRVDHGALRAFLDEAEGA